MVRTGSVELKIFCFCISFIACHKLNPAGGHGTCAFFNCPDKLDRQRKPRDPQGWTLPQSHILYSILFIHHPKKK